MLPQRNMQRLGLRLAKQARPTPARNVVQRRFNSTENKPDWLVDNKFNRERENVKHHAASTSSTSLAPLDICFRVIWFRAANC
jgi:cytochrome c oxidase subunit 6a